MGEQYMPLDYSAIVEDVSESFTPPEETSNEMSVEDINSKVFNKEEMFVPDENASTRENLENEADLVAKKAGAQPEKKEKKNPIEKLKQAKFKIKTGEGEMVADLDTLVAKAREAETLRKQLAQYSEATKNISQEKKTIDIVEDMMAQGKSIAEIKQALEEKYAKLLEEESKSPEQRRAEENERKLREYEKREQERKAAEEKQMRERALAAKQQEIEEKLVEAFEEAKYLPKDPLFMKFAVQEMIGARAVGHTMTPKEAVKIVEGKAVDMIAEMLRRSPITFVKKVLGEDVIAKLRDESVQEYKKSMQQFQQPFSKPQAKNINVNTSQEQKEKIGQKDFFKRLRNL